LDILVFGHSGAQKTSIAIAACRELHYKLALGIGYECALLWQWVCRRRHVSFNASGFWFAYSSKMRHVDGKQNLPIFKALRVAWRA
jgi:hypothetical protein